MADFNEFVPALPFTLKWSLNDNPFDDSDANPKQMSIAIPVKSADAFAAHIYKMAADEKYIKRDIDQKLHKIAAYSKLCKSLLIFICYEYWCD